MSKLRQQMIDAMRQRGYSVRTHEAYLAAVVGLASYYRRSPARLSADQVKDYLRHLAVKRSLSGSTCRQQLHAVRFLYEQVLGRQDFDCSVPLPKLAQRIPELLLRAEVARILGATHNLKHYMLLATCYGCGLRVSELVAIRVRRDIDGERRLLRVEQGKGGKDRLVPIGPTLLQALRDYWRRFRPEPWLFAQANHPDQPLRVSTCQKVFQRAKAEADIEKVGGIHALRHANATHQLEDGLALPALQRKRPFQAVIPLRRRFLILTPSTASTAGWGRDDRDDCHHQAALGPPQRARVAGAARPLRTKRPDPGTVLRRPGPGAE